MIVSNLLVIVPEQNNFWKDEGTFSLIAKCQEILSQTETAGVQLSTWWWLDEDTTSFVL